MPPWAALAPRATTLLRRTAIERLPPSRTPLPPFSCRRPAHPPFTHLCVRSASTHVAPSAIHLRPNIPAHNAELHAALSALSSAAETWVNPSRLHLALSGLAVQYAVTRVAVLGLNSQASAQQLARLLLADPLGEEGEWERELSQAGGRQKAVLLKYADEADVHTPTPLYHVISVPSRVLQLHNMEILVSTLNVHAASHAAAASTESSTESILVPKLQATSARGAPVPYPVHKTLILGRGLDDAIAFGRFSVDRAEEKDDVVKLAIHLPAPSEDHAPEVQERSAAVDMEVGTRAIATFRESIQNSIAYEHGWFRSGLPALSTWLVQDLQSSDAIKPTMKTLVASIANDVEAKLTKEDVALLQRQISTPADSATKTSILAHLSSWAETSHTELRDHLDDAFSSRNWHKLAWYKLLWRVDDVTMFSTEILERRWLISAEKNSIYLAGRMNQAGFPDDLQHVPVTESPRATAAASNEPTTEGAHQDLSMTTEVKKREKWINQIASARAELIKDVVPPLQALAQRLLLQTFSTTAISSALTAILYVGLDSFSLFEAGAVAALGLTFSLRRMQKLWEGARDSWQGTAREEGRRTLKRTEDAARLVVEKTELGGAEWGVDAAGREKRARAREAVKRVREVLDRT